MQDALKQLWRLAYPNRELPSLKSELWKDMGWQGPDPSTDFRYEEDFALNWLSWLHFLFLIYMIIYVISMLFEGVEDSYHWRISSFLPRNIQFVAFSLNYLDYILLIMIYHMEHLGTDLRL